MNESRLVTPTRKFEMSQSWSLPNLNETNWSAFLITIGSISRFLTRIGSEYLLVGLKSYLAVLKPKTSNVLQYLSKCSCKSINWIFLVFRNRVELFSELSSSAAMPTQWLRRWFIVSRIRGSLLSLRFQYQGSSFSLELDFANPISPQHQRKIRESHEDEASRRKWVLVSFRTKLIQKLECVSQPMSLFRYPWSFHFPHILIQIQRRKPYC